jgi:hypothetical protein
MGNNRKGQSGAVRFVPACKAVLLCTLLGGSCVGYVVQKNKIFELGQQIGVRQVRLERLKKENQVLAEHLATLRLPRRLAERARELNLGLAAPSPSQMLWITELLPAEAPSATNAQFHYVQSSLKP